MSREPPKRTYREPRISEGWSVAWTIIGAAVAITGLVLTILSNHAPRSPSRSPTKSPSPTASASPIPTGTHGSVHSSIDLTALLIVIGILLVLLCSIAYLVYYRNFIRPKRALARGKLNEEELNIVKQFVTHELGQLSILAHEEGRRANE
jgi:beta-lactamase regulating signal transducer with metallopeptidase domain